MRHSSEDRTERRRLRNHLLRRLAGGAALTLLLIALVYGVRNQHDARHDDARILGQHMERAYAALTTGELEPSDVDGPYDLVAAVVERRDREPVTMLVGDVAGDCYVVYWVDGGERAGRAVADWVECTPAPATITTNDHGYERITPLLSWHLPGVRSSFDFEDLLPPPTRRRPWVIPTLLVLAAVLLHLGVRASIVLLTGSADPPA